MLASLFQIVAAREDIREIQSPALLGTQFWRRRKPTGAQVKSAG